MPERKILQAGFDNVGITIELPPELKVNDSKNHGAALMAARFAFEVFRAVALHPELAKVMMLLIGKIKNATNTLTALVFDKGTSEIYETTAEFDRLVDAVEKGTIQTDLATAIYIYVLGTVDVRPEKVAKNICVALDRRDVTADLVRATRDVVYPKKEGSSP